jgi:glycosyltransferase involved in cell wall biosynthesis
MNFPLLSVAIISYNHAEFIEEAIKSVLEQSYPNIEIVISDDASSDNTAEIIQKCLGGQRDKVKYILNSQNIGPVDNWFQCVSECRGKYIIGLAGDDQFYPDQLYKQVEIMERDLEIAICYADATVFDLSNEKILYRLSDKSSTKSGGVEIALRDTIYYSPTMMWRSSLTPKENSFKGIRYGADLAFYKEIMILSAPNGKICYLPEVVYKYCKHKSNLTVTTTQYRKDHIEAIQILQKKYPEYRVYLKPSIYDFCCVAFLKNIAKFNLSEVKYYFIHGLKAADFNPFKFFRVTVYAIKFIKRRYDLTKFLHSYFRSESR